jgi:uncharacterized protein YbjT (DUF2867 family)
MTNRILVTGGTGTVGRVVVDRLTAAGKDVRVLSRGRRAHQRTDVEHVVGDVGSGAGLDRRVGPAKPPLMALPAGLRFQPVDVRDVGARLAQLALGEPLGRAPDFGGPRARPLDDLARSYLAIVGKRRPIVPIRLPGKAFGGIRAGGLLAPEHAAGTITFEQYLGEQVTAGELPYRDAIRAYLPRRPGRGC